MFKSQCMINIVRPHLFEKNAGIYQLTEVLQIFQHMHFCRYCFSTMVSYRYVLGFWIFFLSFVIVLWVTKIVHQN